MNTGLSDKTQGQQDELFLVDEKLRSYLKDEVGLDLSRIDLDQLVASIKKNNDRPENFDSFSSAVSSLIAVHETYFMRHREQFDWIEQQWLPDILDRKRNADESRIVRILSAGCATGEEAYSLCAHLKPVFDHAGLVLEIDAVDICGNSLNTARRGRYSLWSLRGVSAEHEQQWLDVMSRNVEVKDWVKNSVNFYRHNITRAFPLADIKKYDLVLCRNVMIYMHADAIRQAFRNIAALLKPDGVLIPGPSDPNPVGESQLQGSWVRGVRLFRKANAGPLPVITPAGQVLKDDGVVQTPSVSGAVQAPATELNGTALVNTFTPYAEIEMQIRLCQYDRARTALERNIETDMLDVRSYVMLAELAMDLQELRLAGTAVRNALFLRQDSLYVNYLMANYKRAVGDHDGERYAIQWLKKNLQEKDENQPVEFCEAFTVAVLHQVIETRLSC